MTVDFPDDPDAEREQAFEFDQTAPDCFQSRPLPSGLLRLYGGMIVAQALAAMRRTVPDDKDAHALHLFYQRPGLTDRPLKFAVERDTDGYSFAQRRVAVTQDGNAIAHAMASFHIHEPGAAYQQTMPAVPDPSTLEPLTAIFARQIANLPARHHPFWLRKQMFDWRPVETFLIGDAGTYPPQRHFWFRANSAIDAPLHVQQRLLCYACDTHIMQNALRPLGIAWADDHLQSSSLDFAIWFHAPFRVDEWLLYALDSPASSSGRVLGTGSVFRQDGVLAATVIQQGLARMLDGKREGKI